VVIEAILSSPSRVVIVRVRVIIHTAVEVVVVVKVVVVRRISRRPVVVDILSLLSHATLVFIFHGEINVGEKDDQQSKDEPEENIRSEAH
jgi:hypothetical protein